MKIDFPPTIILRHKRENLRKCSLYGLESRQDMIFLTYPKDPLPDLTNYIILSFQGPVLSTEDSHRGIFLIDGTWRYAAQMLKKLPVSVKDMHRSLPTYLQTAYPRRQTDCPYPNQGLASIEALYSAYELLGREASTILDRYYWKDLYLRQNGLLKK